jgi:YVTN family beta-propeller protein
MRVCVLGPIEVHAGERVVPIGGGRQRALLALLLLHAGEVVSRDRLIDELWAGAPPPSADRSLDAYVSRLRRALREAGGDGELVTRPPGYMLVADDLDATRFEALAAAGREAVAAGEHSQGTTLLSDALMLWRGGAYADVADEPWARTEVARLEALRLGAIEARIDAELGLGRHAAIVAELEALTARHPGRERLAEQRILALYRCGRQADALAVYRETHRGLVEDFGVEPGPAMRRLQQQVLAQDPALALNDDSRPTPPPAPTTEDPRPGRSRRNAAPRRWTLTAGVGLVVLVGIALTALLAGADAPPDRPLRADGAGAIDPRSGRTLQAVATGSSPAAIASSGRSLWVANAGDGTVSRIDARDGHVRQTLRVGGGPTAIAAGAGAVWVANTLDGTVSRIDPRADAVVQTITVGGTPVAVATGAGAVWVADRDGDALVAIDPVHGIPRRRIPVVAPGGVAVGFDSVWVTEPTAHAVVRVDPRTASVQATIATGGGAGPVAVGAGAVWVVNVLDGTVSRVDPMRNAVSATVPAGDALGAVAAGDGGAWVTDSGRAALVALAPATGLVRRRYRLRVAPAAVALADGVPWIAAGTPTGRAHRGGTLRVRVTAFDSLDPAVSHNVYPSIWAALSDGLVAFAPAAAGGQLVPDLAVAVPQPTDDGLTYAFRLRPGIRYSSGERVRASDFRRGFERLFSVGAPLAPTLGALRGANRCTTPGRRCDLRAGVVTNDRAGTVILHLRRRDPLLLASLTLGIARPVPPGTPALTLARDPVPGTGPYRVARFVPRREIVMVRNPRFREWSYAAQPAGYPDRIEIALPVSAESVIRPVLRGAADIALDITPNDLGDLRSRYSSQLRTHGYPATAFLHLNERRPPFDDLRARQAANLAIDRAAIARAYGGGAVATPACQPLPPGLPGYRAYCPWTRAPRGGRWHGTDLRRARALVRASGTAGARVDIVSPPVGPVGPATSRIVADGLRRIGYRPRVVVMASDDATSRRVTDPDGGWQLSPNEWVADFASPAEFLDVLLTCARADRRPQQGPTFNPGGFCDPSFDRMVHRAENLQATDPTRADALWRRADRFATDRAAWIPTVNLSSTQLLSRRTRHLTYTSAGFVAIDQLRVR